MMFISNSCIHHQYNKLRKFEANRYNFKERKKDGILSLLETFRFSIVVALSSNNNLKPTPIT